MMAFVVPDVPFWLDANFWTNFAVAVGTIALALATFLSVRQTSTVLGAEERRHQQQFAPLLVVERTNTSMRVTNVGMGLAIHAHIKARVRYTTSRQDSVALSPEVTYDDMLRQHPGGFRAPFPSVTSSPYGTRNECFVWNYPVPVDVSFSMEIPALVREGELYFEDEDRLLVGSFEDETIVAEVYYSDIFGNRFETKYLDEHLKSYDWVRPAIFKSSI